MREHVEIIIVWVSTLPSAPSAFTDRQDSASQQEKLLWK